MGEWRTARQGIISWLPIAELIQSHLIGRIACFELAYHGSSPCSVTIVEKGLDMFSKGDRVRIIQSEPYKASNDYLGRIVTIDRAHVEYPRSKHWHVIADDKAQFCVQEDWITLVPTFKPGDRVKGKLSKLFGTVESIEGAGSIINVRWDSVPEYTLKASPSNLKLAYDGRKYPIGSQVKTNSGICTIIQSGLGMEHLYHLEPITPGMKFYLAEKDLDKMNTTDKIGAMLTPKFKIGDRVRYLGGRNDEWIKVGDTGIIKSVGDTSINAQWSNGRWYAHNSEVELVKEGTKIVKITLPNGVTIEGTAEQIATIARTLGVTNVFDPNLWYKSDHLGWVQIKDMRTDHLRNAFMKMYRAWVAEDTTKLTLAEFKRRIEYGIEDKTALAILAELNRR